MKHRMLLNGLMSSALLAQSRDLQWVDAGWKIITAISRRRRAQKKRSKRLGDNP